MKELHAFRKFLSEGKGSTVKLSKSDMDKLHKDGEIEVDDHIIQFGEGEGTWGGNKGGKFDKKNMPWGGRKGKNPTTDVPWGGNKGGKFDKEENVSENTTMPDIEIMGQTFNFSDICPSAHKLVQNQAIVHHGHGNVTLLVLRFAILHRDFFNLERKALGSQGITVDEFNDEVKPLYNKILDVASKLMVRKSAKEYMDMHMGKIKDAGFKASEPGGSSDYKADMDYYMDETGDPDEFLEEKLEEVRNKLGNVVEGYTDLHKNDVILESFLGEEELNEDNTESEFDDYFAPVVGGNKTMPAMNIQQALEDKAIDVDQLSPDYLADFYNTPEFKETLDPEMINRQEFKKAMGRLMQTSYKDITGEEKFENILPYPNYYTFVRFGDDIYLAHEYGKYHTKLSFGTRLRRESLDEKQKYADDQLKFKKGDTVYFKNVKGGKKLPMTITGPGKFMKSNRLGAGGKEVVFPVKGGPGGKGMYAADDLVKEESLDEERPAYKNEFKVTYTVLKGKDASTGTAAYEDEADARKFFNDIIKDDEVVSAKLRKFVGPDSSKDMMGGAAKHEGSEIDIERYVHPAYSKKGDLEGQEANIKMFLSTPSFILKKRGFTSDSPYFEEGLDEGMSDGFNDREEKTIMGHAKEAATEAGALEPKFSPKLGGIMVRFPHSSGPSGAALTAKGQRTMSGQILDDTKRAATYAGELFIDMVKDDLTLPQLEQDLLVVEYGPGETAQVIVIPF